MPSLQTVPKPTGLCKCDDFNLDPAHLGHQCVKSFAAKLRFARFVEIFDHLSSLRIHEGAAEWMTRVYDSLGGAESVYAFKSSARIRQPAYSLGESRAQIAPDYLASECDLLFAQRYASRVLA
jgi:hypothetical protein